MACSSCDERHVEQDDDGYGCENCSCGCHGCDCCSLCVGDDVGDDEQRYSCCSSYPEYNCPGECRHRGEPGHYQLKPPGDPHPLDSWPERFCSKPCCRPEVR
jgi:hypothetical protein